MCIFIKKHISDSFRYIFGLYFKVDKSFRVKREQSVNL